MMKRVSGTREAGGGLVWLMILSGTAAMMSTSLSKRLHALSIVTRIEHREFDLRNLERFVKLSFSCNKTRQLGSYNQACAPSVGGQTGIASTGDADWIPASHNLRVGRYDLRGMCAPASSGEAQQSLIIEFRDHQIQGPWKNILSGGDSLGCEGPLP